MQKDIVEARIKGIMPAGQAFAIFLGPEEKTFVIYVDQHTGAAISMAVNKTKKERPLTHDLIASILLGLGVTLERVIISHVDEGMGTFFARLILKMENELGSKLVEVDARPSDSMALALQAGKPIFVARAVLDNVEDMTEVLEKILKQQN